MKTKEFDCVQMKRQGAEIIFEEIKNMTLEEQLEYWKKGTAQLQKEQQIFSRKRRQKTK